MHEHGAHRQATNDPLPNIVNSDMAAASNNIRRSKVFGREEKGEKLTWEDDFVSGPTSPQRKHVTPQRPLPVHTRFPGFTPGGDQSFIISDNEHEDMQSTATMNQPPPGPSQHSGEEAENMPDGHGAVSNVHVGATIKKPRARVKWSDAETELLEQGLARFGKNWVGILRHYGQSRNGFAEVRQV